MKASLLLLALPLLCEQLAAATGDIVSAAVEARGCWVDIVLSGDVRGGTQAFGFTGSTNLFSGAEKLVFTVTGGSFDSSGGATTMQRTVYGQFPLRLPYPSTTSAASPAWDETFSGGNTTVKVVLSDYIYSGETVTLNALSGFYTKSGTPNAAVSGMSVTNNSTAAYQEHGLWWTMGSRTRLVGTGNLTLSACSFSRHWKRFQPVRAMKFVVTDQSGGTQTVWSYDPVLTTTATFGDQKPIIEYVASVPVTGFHDGDTLTCNVTSYPWAGNTAKTSVGGPAEPSPLCGPRTFLLDMANTRGIAVRVDTTGTDVAEDATKAYNDASYNDATAYKFLTLGRALASGGAKNAAAGHDDVGAVIVYCGAGSYSFLNTTNSFGNAPTVRPEIRPAPGVDPATVIINGTGGTTNIDLVKLTNLTLTSTSNDTFGGVEDVWMDHCTLNTSGTGVFRTTGQVVTLTQCTVPQFGQGFKGNSGTNVTFGLVRGCNLDGLAGQHIVYTNIGCRGINMGSSRFVEEINGVTGPVSTPLLAYFEFTGLNSTGNENIEWGDVSNSSPGCYLIQGVVENCVAGAAGIVSIHCGDRDYKNGMTAYLTNVGQRNFYHYNDQGSVAYFRDFGVEAFCAHHRTATKNDLLSPQNGGRIGGWPLMMGVACIGDYAGQTMVSVPNNFNKECAGIASYQTAQGSFDEFQFTNTKSAKGTNGEIGGEGNGNYRPEPATPMTLAPAAYSLLKWDLDGVTREDNECAGAYTIPQGARRSPLPAKRAVSLMH